MLHAACMSGSNPRAYAGSSLPVPALSDEALAGPGWPWLALAGAGAGDTPIFGRAKGTRCPALLGRDMSHVKAGTRTGSRPIASSIWRQAVPARDPRLRLPCSHSRGPVRGHRPPAIAGQPWPMARHGQQRSATASHGPWPMARHGQPRPPTTERPDDAAAARGFRVEDGPSVSPVEGDTCVSTHSPIMAHQKGDRMWVGSSAACPKCLLAWPAVNSFMGGYGCGR